MLHILLGLLKIIGIILAVIIGLVLLIICVVLFSAIRYEVKALADGNVKSLEADVKFSWLFHLVSGYLIYKEQKMQWQVKIAWKKLNDPKEEKELVLHDSEQSTVEQKEKVLEEKTEKKSAKEQTVEVQESVEKIPEKVKKPKTKAKKSNYIINHKGVTRKCQRRKMN